MLLVTLALLASALAPDSGARNDSGESIHAILPEESPDVFLAKATLRQYLERVVRKDWEGVKRLTHPKALTAIASAKRRGEIHDLAPWAADDELKTFELHGARSPAPGSVLVEVTEDQEPATYVVFKSRGSWLVGGRKPGARLSDISDESIRAGYPGWVDHQALTQARRAERSRVSGRSRAAPRTR
jgi:hypothetical protein